MARQRRGGGFRPPELRGTLGTLLRTTLEQAGAVRDALERGARSRFDEARSQRRRKDTLAELGELVLDLIRRGEIDLTELPEAHDLVRQLDDLDADAPDDPDDRIAQPPTRRRFDARARDAEPARDDLRDLEPSRDDFRDREPSRDDLRDREPLRDDFRDRELSRDRSPFRDRESARDRSPFRDREPSRPASREHEPSRDRSALRDHEPAHSSARDHEPARDRSPFRDRPRAGADRDRSSSTGHDRPVPDRPGHDRPGHDRGPDDGTVSAIRDSHSAGTRSGPGASAGRWSPPKSSPPQRVWRPSLADDESPFDPRDPRDARDPSDSRPNRAASHDPNRAASHDPNRAVSHDPHRKGGIQFDDDEDLANYMHPDDVPPKPPSDDDR
jgi:hypothetical protein